MIQRKQLTPQFIRVQERIAKIADIKAHADDCAACSGSGYNRPTAFNERSGIGCAPCYHCNGTGKKRDRLVLSRNDDSQLNEALRKFINYPD